MENREVQLSNRRHQGIGAYVMGKNNDDNNDSIIDSNTIRIPLLTLEDILDNSKDLSNDIILKIDCEGCEYRCYPFCRQKYTSTI